MRRLFVTGTDTDVGKTVLSLMLTRSLMEAGHSCIYLKPVQTGITNPSQSDPATLDRFLPTGLPLGMTPQQCIGAICPQPKAPLFAKCPATDDINVASLAAFIRQHDHVDVQIIEGAGGLFVPLNWKETMLDLAAELQVDILLAARAGLGTINHTLLSVTAIRSRELACSVILLDPQGLTPREDIQENIRAIEHFGQIQVAATIDRIGDLHHPPCDMLKKLNACYGLSKYQVSSRD